jgi:ABC-type transport system involved in multi-copper enzyme maturation permease subunit
MNLPMVSTLIKKDWTFNRWPLLVYGALGLAAAFGLGLPSETAFFASGVLLITVLISVGIHLTMVTVVYERQQQTLAFVMSLPISQREYTLAKLVANLTIFGTAWAAITIATLAVIASRSWVPDGLIPYALTILLQLFVGYLLTLSVALVSESMPWTIGAIVAGNLLVQGVMFAVGRVPAVAAVLKTDSVLWVAPIPAILATEVAVIVGLVALTFFLQSRKTDFL